MTEKVCIIGLGKLGSHLYYSLNKTRKFHVSYIVRNSKAKIIPAKLNSCSIIFICTGDSAITKAVNKLRKKQFELKNKFIYHTSGALDSSLLKPLKAKGAFTASFHPVQTFESRVTGHNRRLNGIYIVTEGNITALKKAEEIAKALHSKTVRISKSDKVLHHINSVIASNYSLVLMNMIEHISSKLSIPYLTKKILKNGFKKSSFLNIYKPLIQQTLNNAENYGTVKSLTGPIERNDIATVLLHLKTLRNRAPELLPFYTLMGMETTGISLKKISINTKDAARMMSLLKKFSKQKEKKN